MSPSLTPRIYSYVRFSSERQLQGDSLRRQNELIDKYTKEKKLELDSEYRLVDKAISAFKGENIRTGKLGRFLELVSDKKIATGSVLLVESLDRLTRMKIREALPLFLDIINAGITIVTLIDGREHSAVSIDKHGEMELFASLMVLTRAHEESRTKSERLKKAWEEKRNNISTKFYTKRIPTWLRLSKDEKKIQIIPLKAKTVQRIFRLCLEGNHSEGIARLFYKQNVPLVGKAKVWSHSFVSQALRSSAVTGEFTPHKIVNGKRVPAGPCIPDFFPQIVSKDDFNRVQFIMDSRTKNTKGGRVSPGANSIFRKVLFCGYCGAPVYRTAKGRYYKGELRKTLICRNAKDGTGCFYVGWEYKEFEEAFLASATELRHALSDKFDGKPLRNELENLLGEEKQIAIKNNNLMTVAESLDGNIKNAPALLLKKISELQNRLNEITVTKSNIEKKLSAGMEGATPLLRLEKMLKKLENPETRKAVSDLVCQMFARIDLFPAGSKFQLAKLKSIHAKLVKKRGKADQSVSAQVRELFNRREIRFFQAVLNLHGVEKRIGFSSNGKLIKENRLDLVEDLPNDADMVN